MHHPKSVLRLSGVHYKRNITLKTDKVPGMAGLLRVFQRRELASLRPKSPVTYTSL